MTKRKRISSMASKKLFKKTANTTNTKNLPGRKAMMRGGFHF